MRKLIKIIVIVIILGVIGYHIAPVGFLIYGLRSQMKVGQKYMDSITEKDIPVWIERTERYLKEYDPDPNASVIGVYSSHGDKPIPPELEKLKILRIDIAQDHVSYVWLGGLDHTILSVFKTEDGDFRFIGRYNDYNSKVIWPREDANDVQEEYPIP